jgi:hypothetical protein
MALTTKKNLGLAGAIGAVLYLAQNYTLTGLNHLRLEPISTRNPTTVPSWNDGAHEPSVRPTTQAGMTRNFPSSSQASRYPASPTTSTFPSLNVTAAPSPVPIPDAMPGRAVSATARGPVGRPLRMATFNLHLFGQHKAENPFVIETVAKILRQYDIVALQEICTKQQDLLPLLIERINQSDRRFDYVIGPRVGRTDNKEQFAFVFDTQTLETALHSR